MPGRGKFWQEETGASAAEYCILASCIAVVIVVALIALGSILSAQYQSMATSLRS